MWSASVQQQSRQQCAMERIQSPNQRAPHHSIGLFARRGAPHPHLPFLSFPPPPNYPPPHPSTSSAMEDHLLAIPGPSTQRDPWEMPNDYSYAYYEPGPPTRHTNVPNKCPGTTAYKEGSYRSRHTYMTRYGTEENIYEEISEVARARMRPQQHQESIGGFYLLDRYYESL